MAKRESVQKKLQRIRPPRVQLTYDVEVGDGKESKELPDEVMESLAPRAAFQVDNTLTEEGGRMSVDLTFNSMEDFRPEQVVQQVDPLRKLVAARERLTDLRNKISNSERLEDLLDEVLQNTDQVRQLSAEAENE